MEKQIIYNMRDTAAAIDKVIHELVVLDNFENVDKFLKISTKRVDEDVIPQITVEEIKKQRANIINLDNVPSVININNHDEIRIDAAADKIEISANVEEDEFYGLIIVKTNFESSMIAEDFISGDIVVINNDLDISDYTVVHINIYYDGFNLCAVVSGYKK